MYEVEYTAQNKYWVLHDPGIQRMGKQESILSVSPSRLGKYIQTKYGTIECAILGYQYGFVSFMYTLHVYVCY